MDPVLITLLYISNIDISQKNLNSINYQLIINIINLGPNCTILSTINFFWCYLTKKGNMNNY